eukprot:11790130-Karenia_brevis.AAC.1
MPLHDEMHSRRLLDRMHDVINYNAAISACERGMMHDVISFSAVISACERDGQWWCVALPLSVMHNEGLSLDVISFNADISSLALDGQWQRAMPLHEEMRSSRLLDKMCE